MSTLKKINLNKVLPRQKITEIKNVSNTEDQKNYNDKVSAFSSKCKIFYKSFSENIIFPNQWKELFDTSFKDQMKYSILTSRTSRILHEISNKLSKFKENSFEPENSENYKKAFKFKAIKPNQKGYIKRSAIDDAEISHFFNVKIPSSIEIENDNIKARYYKNKKELEQVYNEINSIMQQKNSILDLAESVKKNINKTIKDVKKGKFDPLTAEALQECEKNIESCKEIFLVPTKLLNKLMLSAKSILKSKKILPHEMSRALIELKLSKEKITDPYNRFKSAIEKGIDTCEESYKLTGNNLNPLFDEKTATLTIKSLSDFKKVKKYKDKIVKVVIANDNIKKIEDGGIFQKCELLQTVDLGGVEYLGNYTFCSCHNLHTIKNSKSVKSIGKYTFSNCYELEYFNLSHVLKIGEYAFQNCSKLKDIGNPEKVEIIEDFAFWNCEKIENLNLKKVEKIGNSAFSSCQGLESINLENVKEIGRGAFAQCANLEKVTLPKDIGKATIIKETILNQVVGSIVPEPISRWYKTEEEKKQEQTAAQKIKFINDPQPQKN